MGDDELDFEITKETVADAWANMGQGKWGVLQFAPTYNGIPEDFDADKVLIYTGQSASSGQTGPVVRRTGRARTIPTSYTDPETGSGYTTYDGYVLADMGQEYTGDQMREYRSYLMRPVVSVKSVLDAIADPDNNGGYEVVLHPSFFNSGNTYYEKAWVTLPLLTSLDYTATVQDSGYTASLGSAVSGTSASPKEYYEDRVVNITGASLDNYRSMRVKTKVSLEALMSSGPGTTLYPSAYAPSYGSNYECSIFLQLVAYDRFGTAIAGSELVNCTSAYGTRRVAETVGRSTRYQIYTYTPVPSDYAGFTFFGDSYRNFGGGFQYQNSKYVWTSDGGSSEIEMSVSNVPMGCTVKLLVTKVWNCSSSYNTDRWDTLWKRDYNSSNNQAYYTPYYMTGFKVSLLDYEVSFQTDEAIRSGAKFTKKSVLTTDYSPADFLLSYAKLFGLYFLKDPYRKKVTVMPRSEFFKRSEIVDVQDLIDRSNTSEMTPVSFETKWYEWALKVEGEYAKDFEKTYGHSYGAKRINTGLGFNNQTTKVLDNNIFKSGVQVLERDAMYCCPSDDPQAVPWRFNAYTYNLYHGSENTYEVSMPACSTIDLYSGLGDYKYYDIWDKLQCHTTDNKPADGQNILLFFDGFKPLTVQGHSAGYCLTDDNAVMNILNESTPCWLSSYVDQDDSGNTITIPITEAPHYSRYIVNDVGYVQRSWDFGYPDTYFIPGVADTPYTALYDLYWRDYIGDLYNANTRILKTKMRIVGKPDVEWLRRFYWFDNAVWRLQEIKDWNVGKEGLTDVVFVKVMDPANYTDRGSQTGQVITLTPSMLNIPASGATVTLGIAVSDGGSWYLQYDSGFMTPDVTAGTGSTTVTIVFDASQTQSFMELPVTVVGDSGGTAVANFVQEAYTASINWQGGDMPASGGTGTFTVVSQFDWQIVNQYTGIITNVTPSAGTATTGTTIQATWGANTNSGYRDAYLNLYTVDNSGMTRSTTVRQKGITEVYLSHTSKYLDSNAQSFQVWATVYGNPVQISVADPYHFITANWDAQNSTLYVSIAQNTTGSDRNALIDFEDAVTGVRASGNSQLYIVQYAEPDEE